MLPSKAVRTLLGGALVIVACTTLVVWAVREIDDEFPAGESSTTSNEMARIAPPRSPSPDAEKPDLNWNSDWADAGRSGAYRNPELPVLYVSTSPRSRSVEEWLTEAFAPSNEWTRPEIVGIDPRSPPPPSPRLSVPEELNACYTRFVHREWGKVEPSTVRIDLAVDETGEIEVIGLDMPGLLHVRPCLEKALTDLEARLGRPRSPVVEAVQAAVRLGMKPGHRLTQARIDSIELLPGSAPRFLGNRRSPDPTALEPDRTIYWLTDRRSLEGEDSPLLPLLRDHPSPAQPGGFFACYEWALQHGAEPADTVVLELEVDPTGHVSEVDIAQGSASDRLAECLLWRLEGDNLTPLGGPVAFRFMVHFTPPGWPPREGLADEPRLSAFTGPRPAGTSWRIGPIRCNLSTRC